MQAAKPVPSNWHWKLLPASLEVKLKLALLLLLGLVGAAVMLVSGGVGSGVTVKVRGLEVPPPGPGLTTVTWSVPGAARSSAEMAAVSCELVTYVVVRAKPFHCTTEPAMKLLPLTVRVKIAPPAVALLGTRLVSKRGESVMVKVAVTEVSAFKLNMQIPVPAQPPPLQPAKAEPANGVAVRVTIVPL